MKLGTAAAAGLLAMSLSSQAFALTFGIFRNATDPDAAPGAESVLAGIVGAGGHDAAILPNLSNLADLDVLWILNSDFDAQPGEMAANASALNAFVSAGGVLLYHDRNVDQAAAALPGAAGVVFTADVIGDAANIDIVVGTTTLVTDGPAGAIDDGSLDGGSWSSHGYAELGLLPGVGILSRGEPTQIVDFAFDLGLGVVYYSTIPLDYYLADAGGLDPDFKGVYAPNLVAYAASLLDAAPTPEPAPLLLFGGGLLGLGLLRRGR